MKQNYYLVGLIFLVFCVKSCITRNYLEDRRIIDNKIVAIQSYGWHKNMFVVNFTGVIQDKQTKAYHITIPLHEYVEAYRNSTKSFVTQTNDTKQAKTQSNLRTIYAIDHDHSELTPSVLTIELNKQVYHKGFYKSSLKTSEFLLQNHTLNNDYIFDLQAYNGLNPLIIKLKNNKNAEPFQEIILAIEPFALSTNPYVGMLATVPLDLILGIFQLTVCQIFGNEDCALF